MARQGFERKPMAKARRVSLFHKEIRVGLSSAAVEILLGQAQVLSEGQMEGDGFYGSTMVSIACDKAREWVSDQCDATTVRQVGELLLADRRFKEKVRELGEREAHRMAERRLGAMQIELSVRTEGVLLHVDVDIEATLAEAIAL
jgi:hypothetical protein